MWSSEETSKSPREAPVLVPEMEHPAESEYNPLIVRRSQRAIKPTKDIDLYLLGAQFGVDVEGSDVDSSDLEFAPETVSDGEDIMVAVYVSMMVLRAVESNSSLSSDNLESMQTTSVAKGSNLYESILESSS